MNFLQKIAQILQYPQSVATGLASSGGGMFGTGHGPMIGEGEDQTVGLERIIEGLQGDLRPSDIARRNNPNDDPNSVAAKIGSTGMDVILDPTLLLGGPVRKLTEGTKFAPVVAGAGTFGKVEKAVAPEGATGLAKLLAERSPQIGQLARRTLQGTLATGDPLTGLAAGQVLGVGERGLDMLLPKLASRLMSQGNVNTSGLGVVDEAVGSGVDNLISMPAIDRVKIMGELNPAPGFGIEQPPVGGWNPRPAAVPQFDEALQELLAGASRRTVDQGLGQVGAVRPDLTRGYIKPPMFEDSLEQLLASQSRGTPSLPREPLALNPAPVAMPMDVLSPSTERATMASIQDLIEQLQDPRRRALVLGQLNGN